MTPLFMQENAARHANTILEFMFYGVALVGVYCIVVPIILLTLAGLRRLKTPAPKPAQKETYERRTG